MERLDLYNQHDEPLHETIDRNALKGAQAYVRVVHVWLYFPDGTYLIQQRNKPSDPIPYQFATTTGMPVMGESPSACALREVEEELGLRLEPSTLSLYDKLTTHTGPYKTITYRYFAPLVTMPSADQLDATEVKAIERVRLSTIEQMVEDTLFWNYEKLLKAPGYFKALDVKR